MTPVSPSLPSGRVWARYEVEQIPSTTEVAVELLDDLPQPRNVIDLGCGTGRCVASLVGMLRASIVGVDVNYRAMQAARRGCGNRVGLAFVTADANRLPFGDEVFDLAIAQAFFTVIPTRAEREAILGEVRRMMLPGGHLYVGDFLQQQANSHYQSRYRRGYELTGEYGTFAVTDPSGAITYFAHHFSKHELTDLLEGQGFQVMKSSTSRVKTYSGNEIEGVSLISRLKA